MPSGYIFWPTANVFVHPSMLKSDWYDYSKKNSQTTPADSMESLSGVMKVRPQKPDLDVATQKSTKIDTKKISEVCIDYFKRNRTQLLNFLLSIEMPISGQCILLI